MAEFTEQLITWRRAFHQVPECAHTEVETTKRLRDILVSYDITILETPLQTGLIAEIGQGDTFIAVRSDIDALPIIEQTDLPFASNYKGVMHACGHDIHMASILGAAIRLKAREQQLPGRVRFIFQAAEEVSQGANAVVQTGVLKGAKAIIGFHNDPTLPVGTWRAKSGYMTSNVDRFKIDVTGVGAHAAMPQDGIDPHIILSHLISGLQTIVSRNVAPYDEAVVTIGQVHSGDTWNVIPSHGMIEGTVRTLTPEVRDLVEMRMQQLCEGLAMQYQASVALDYQRLTDGVNNDDALQSIAWQAAEKTGYEVQAQPRAQMIGEDFASYQQVAPIHFAMIGSNSAYPLHHPQYNPDEAILDKTPDYFVNFVECLFEQEI
ncbi:MULTISPECIES: amidohydrolase [unclassified Staphylococcus]|uniref:amidohydrolase n=1 Tax=unclassified Staphylococcus TaxID=91994 RepID=UPI0021D02C07|nr:MULTISPECIES: amidohydrolase [unclassified Staphylococcus]UXR78049.1 amidohydrolase [Staphylococcus sp. IVB6227]UXR82212.1 amidohydrolase [Staphylococcus sp. IVB6214]